MVTHTLKKEKEGYLSNMILPWISPDNLKVEITNNQVHIYSIMEFGENGGYDGVKRLSYTLGMLDVPYDVNINGISAMYDDGILKIKLPYNELAGGFRREISIDKS